MWQEIVTYVIVAGAAVFLIWSLVRSFRGEEGGCGGSCACDAMKKPDANLGTRRDLVQVGIERGKGDA
ncbi:MAG: FeoB-associated Cys-rich membrane protein [Planctomycetota bacterium]